MTGSAPVTQLLQAWSDGDEAALAALVPLVEAELRRLARAYTIVAMRNARRSGRLSIECVLSSRRMVQLRG